jgi:voltage-gated potassium channel Kch
MEPSVKRSWRIIAALAFFLAGLIGFAGGTTLSERPEVAQAGLLAQAYYSLSLFVVGGIELGTPVDGPLPARLLLWIAYFGAPILAASTLIEALLRAISPHNLYLRQLRNHVVIVGVGQLTFGYLRELRQHHPRVPVVVVTRTEPEPAIASELKEEYDVTLAIGDVTQEFFVRQLRVKRARRVMMLSDNSLRSYEAVSNMLHLARDIGGRIVIHCADLRFMRAMHHTRVALQCETFNSFQLAASALVRQHLLPRFHDSRGKDIVVLAGFGHFGQSIVEELQRSAVDDLDTLAIIERDADRRVLVAEEQMSFSTGYRREVYEGDISHPRVWLRLRSDIHIEREASNVVFILGTRSEEDNLRTALWLRRIYPNAMVLARSRKESRFAEQVSREHNIINISIYELVEKNLPPHWVQL